MSLSRYFLNIEDRVPVHMLSVLERGAIVNGVQEAVNTVTVHAGHEFATSDKFLYAPTRLNVQRDRVFTVSSFTSTTITFSGGSFSFPDKAYLVNLGQDTGGVLQPDGSFSKLNFDAAAITVYSDPAGDAVWTDSQVSVDPGGEVGFWANGRTVWGCALDGGGRAIRIYTDIGSSAASVPAGSALPSTGTPGQLFILAGGTGVGDIVYVYVKFTDDTYDWLEIGNAS